MKEIIVEITFASKPKQEDVRSFREIARDMVCDGFTFSRYDPSTNKAYFRTFQDLYDTLKSGFDLDQNIKSHQVSA